MVGKLDFSKVTPMDALDLACLIEVEAYRRYLYFTEQLGHRDPGDAASVFSLMAENEKKHGEQLAERRLAVFGNAPRNVKLDDIFDVEAPDFGLPHSNMSPLAALKIALMSEQKAFAFYDDALSVVKQPAVKELFEELRDEESGHIRMIEEIIAKSPPEAAKEVEDLDAD